MGGDSCIIGHRAEPPPIFTYPNPNPNPNPVLAARYICLCQILPLRVTTPRIMARVQLRAKLRVRLRVGLRFRVRVRLRVSVTLRIRFALHLV